VDDHVHDVLHVFRFVHSPEPHLFERVVLDAGEGGVGRIELETDLPIRWRTPAVSCQFSPFRPWTKVEYGKVSGVGTTTPTPLPLRVGAATWNNPLGLP
jgi:hypothetical protein